VGDAQAANVATVEKVPTTKRNRRMPSSGGLGLVSTCTAVLGRTVTPCEVVIHGVTPPRVLT
jgi:hypothetical protein